MLHCDYEPDQLRFAYCYHAYLRWCTHALRPWPPLAALDVATLHALAERFAIRVLEGEGRPTEVRVLVSLRPGETIAGCASKLKGQTSKWLRQAPGHDRPMNLLSKGYFACTAGKSEPAQVDRYLSGQGDHHGYSARPLPPVWVESAEPTAALEARLRANHAWTVLRFHLVLATWQRRGVFGTAEARAVADGWRALQLRERFALLKVSFVPDHVHLAVRTHPSVAPAQLVAVLMNAGQKLLWERFPEAAIQARVERLWQPSAYVGSFGDLATPKIQHYLRNWSAQRASEAGEAPP
jgi:REP element-mobilizing transposase RayT